MGASGAQGGVGGYPRGCSVVMALLCPCGVAAWLDFIWLFGPCRGCVLGGSLVQAGAAWYRVCQLGRAGRPSIKQHLQGYVVSPPSPEKHGQQQLTPT